MMRRAWAALMIVLAAAGCRSESQTHPLWRGVLEGYRAKAEEVVAANPIGANEAVKFVDVDKNNEMSVHVVQVRAGHALQAHFHLYHEETVHILRGSGTMTIGEEACSVAQGSYFTIPKGVRHVFRNTGSETAIAVVAYQPPFDGTDRVFDHPK